MLRRILFTVVPCALFAPLAWAAPATHTIAVDCAKGKTIQQALAHPAERLVIEISGLCQERVVITRSNVTLRGSNPATDGITGPAVDDVVVQRALVRVIAARDVGFENLTITSSESRGLEGHDLAFIEIVNCRITGNEGRGVQMNLGSFASVEDSVIADNGNFELATFSGGHIVCTRCTVDDDDGLLAVSVRGGVIDFNDSALSTGGALAVLPVEESSVFGTDTDVAAGLISLYATQNSQLHWTGGQVAGSIWADTASQLFLNGVTQTVNPAGNRVSEDSHVRIDGGNFVGDTLLTGFSSGTAEGSPTFDTVTCDRGGDFFCDGTVMKTGSVGCGLCP